MYAEGYRISPADRTRTASSIVQHARIVKRNGDRRRLLAIAGKIARGVRENCAAEISTLFDQAFSDLQAHYPVAAAAERGATWADLDRVFGPIEWEWGGWIPRGFLTLLVGESGVGKSILALHFCALFLGAQGLWPDSTDFGGATGDVLWVEAEAAQWLNWERARSWGLPVERIRTPFADPLHEVQLENPAHRRAIERAARQPEVRFAVVDSLSGASQGDENSIEILSVVKWLAALARDAGKAILLLHHLRKPGLLDASGRSELARVRGHSSIVQPTRVVLALDTPDPLDPETRRLRVVKNNIGPLPQPLGLRITGQGVLFCEAPQAPRRVSALEQAVETLKAILAGGPQLAHDIQDELNALDISWRTARRAKEKMGVLSQRVNGVWQWSLPD
jgi:energy-coupling factor transporter ATP-binding protein EcfA2